MCIRLLAFRTRRLQFQQRIFSLRQSGINLSSAVFVAKLVECKNVHYLAPLGFVCEVIQWYPNAEL